MGEMLRGRVAVITGAGRGIGRAHALAMAKEGARIVVNDLGVGDGKGASAANEVVEEIRRSGGAAVANHDSVATPEGADRIIRTAIEKFGRLDILVNNASIIRYALVFDMSDEDFDQVLKVHLYGTFYCTRAACRIMKEQGYGRIVCTSSMGGLGNAGMANYSAAKEGIIGFVRSVGKEMVKFGTTCNAICPRATTPAYQQYYRAGELYKLVSVGEPEKVPPKHAYLPEDVSPLVVYLASEQAHDVTCCVFDVYYNYVGIYDDRRVARTLIKEEGRWTPEELSEALPRTLTEGLQRPSLTPVRKLTSDSKGWKWANGKLTEVPAMIV